MQISDVGRKARILGNWRHNTREAQLRKTTCMNRLGDGSLFLGYFHHIKASFLCSLQTPDLLGFLYSFRKMRQTPLEKE